MASSLSKNWIKCKFGPDDGKCETLRIKYKCCDCFLEYTNFKDDLIEYKCFICNNNCQISSVKSFKGTNF